MLPWNRNCTGNSVIHVNYSHAWRVSLNLDSLWIDSRSMERDYNDFYRPCRGWAFAILFCLLQISFCFAAGEGLSDSAELLRHRPEEGVALLARGPYQGKGLVFLSTNVIDFTAGEYRFHIGDVTVLFPRERVFLDDRWGEKRCGGRRFQYREINQSYLDSSVDERVYLSDLEGRQIFFHFRDGERKRDCDFIESFISRFRYFSGVQQGSDRLSLPAVVEY